MREVAAYLLEDDATETVTEEHNWAIRAALRGLSTQFIHLSFKNHLYLSHNF